jgi:hypothetical protein
MIVMLLEAKYIRAASRVSLKEKTRAYLGGVYVEVNRDYTFYVATDGLALFAVRRATLEPFERPMYLIIPSDVCKAVPKATKRESDPRVELTNPRDRYQLGNQIFDAIDGAFPDWRRVVPRGDLREPLSAQDPRVAIRLYKAAAELGIGYNPSQFGSGSGSPIVYRWAMHEDILGLCMPCRQPRDPISTVPDWAKGA